MPASGESLYCTPETNITLTVCKLELKPKFFLSAADNKDNLDLKQISPRFCPLEAENTNCRHTFSFSGRAGSPWCAGASQRLKAPSDSPRPLRSFLPRAGQAPLAHAPREAPGNLRAGVRKWPRQRSFRPRGGGRRPWAGSSAPTLAGAVPRSQRRLVGLLPGGPRGGRWCQGPRSRYLKPCGPRGLSRRLASSPWTPGSHVVFTRHEIFNLLNHINAKSTLSPLVVQPQGPRFAAAWPVLGLPSWGRAAGTRAPGRTAQVKTILL